MKESVFTITGMHCATCVLNIDGRLEDTEGIFSSATSFVNKEVRVIYDDRKVSKKRILEIIKKVGYDARIKE